MLSRKTAAATKFLIPVVAIATGMVLPAAAQQSRRPPPSYQQDVAQLTDQDNLRTVAININAQRSALFGKKDLAGIGALYTRDAAYIELLPRFEVMMGTAQIQQHLHELMAASTTENIPNVTSAEMGANGDVLVGGDYYLVVHGDRRVGGRFFQVLRKDGGTWKIAMHTFARTQPVTAGEVDQFHGN
jgi:ketosteroid isomerase-like protein